MANRALKKIPQIQRVSEAVQEAQTEKKKSWNLFLWVTILSGFAIVACFILFLWKQVAFFNWSASVDNELLGTLGDFVGGILGTLIAIYSIAMLVKTLNAQIDSNANMKDTNDNVMETNNAQIKLSVQQLFDNKFQVFFAQYEDTKAAYVDNGLTGRQALESIVASFIAAPFNNRLVYNKRVIASVREYESFYAGNREQLAVHFRELYQLLRLVAESDIDEENRVLYAKCIRGQLSDGELIILRYNCLTDNGIAMRRFVNHFNLLKHLPLMSLFEFRMWTEKLTDKNMRSALDSTFISLRKIMKEGNYTNESVNLPVLELSSRYVIKTSYNEGHTCFIFRLEEDKKYKAAAGVSRPYAEKALDIIGIDEMPDLFYSFLYESFITSNFGLYDNPPNCVYDPIVVTDADDPDSFIFEIEVKGNCKLVLSENQMYPIFNRSLH